MAIYSLSQGMKRIDVPENHIKNNLPIGTVLQWSGYGDHRAVIIKNNGIGSLRFSGHGANYECIDLVDFKRERHDSLGMEHISTKKDQHIAVYYTDVILSGDELLDVIEKEKGAKVQEAQRIEIAQTKAREYKERILKEYAHLEQVTPGKYDGVKIGAKNIRVELKKAFPGVEFSVTGSHYSMGNSIHVSWTDGPNSKAVEAITGKYQEGHFNGMEDIYEDNNDAFNDIFGGAKYVNESRHNSDAAYNRVAAEAGYPQAVFNPNQGGYDGVTYEISDMLKRMTWEK